MADGLLCVRLDYIFDNIFSRTFCVTNGFWSLRCL